jgi:hypothetical protein
MSSNTIVPCPDISFDIQQVHMDIRWLLEKRFSFELTKDCFDQNKQNTLGVNLTHPPMEGRALEIVAEKGWPADLIRSKYLGPLTLGDKPAADAGLDPSSYTIIGEEIADRYVGSVIEQVKQYHAKAYPKLKPVTRVYCAYLNTFSGYRMHIDTHTTFKYHLPVIENKYSFMFSENESGIEMTNLPADGRLWRLDTRKLHSAVNLAPLSNNYRMHIIFSVYDDPFNIYDSGVYAQP